MKILVLSNLYPPAVRGGYEVECAGVVGYLRNRGDDVLVLTSTEGADTVDPDVIRALPLLKHPRRSRLVAPAAAVIAARVAREQMQRFRPDLVFVWNGAQLPHAAIQVILASGTPTAFRVCEQWFGGLFANDRFMRHLDRTGRRAADPLGALARAINALPSLRLDPTGEVPVAISWVSEYLRGSVVVPAGLSPILERTIYPATDRDAGLASVERRESPTPVIAFLGRLSPEKGCDVLITALGLLSERGIRAELVIAGHGSRADLRRLGRAAAVAGVGDCCRFPGHLGVPEIRELLSAATVLAIPSIWAEPFGLVVIEGAFARIPVVASRVGGIPEILTDGDEILLVSPSDPEELARALARTIERPEEARERVSRAFSRVQSMSWRAYVGATGAFVDEALEALTRRGR